MWLSNHESRVVNSNPEVYGKVQLNRARNKSGLNMPKLNIVVPTTAKITKLLLIVLQTFFTGVLLSLVLQWKKNKLYNLSLNKLSLREL